MRKGIDVLGLDIGGTNIRIGLVDSEARLSHFEIGASQQVFGSGAVYGLISFIRDYLSRVTDGRLPAGIALGFPSSVSKDRRTLLSTPNIAGLDGLAIADTLESSLSAPVFVDRDVNMLFYYDKRRYKIPDPGIVLGFYIGTGFGNVIAIDGKILIGKNGVAGELGHIPMRAEHEICGCGNEGCAELFASGIRLQALSARCFPGTDISDIFARHWNSPRVDEYLEDLSLPIAAEITILDPECILIGGGVVQMRGFPAERLEYYICKHTRKPFPAANLHILYSESMQESGVIGAGLYGMQCLGHHFA
ncbi:MAG: allose kinase [Clostridia bacterium]|nr:allose kinase [Clostridia bacterium]